MADDVAVVDQALSIGQPVLFRVIQRERDRQGRAGQGRAGQVVNTCTYMYPPRRPSPSATARDGMRFAACARLSRLSRIQRITATRCARTNPVPPVLFPLLPHTLKEGQSLVRFLARDGMRLSLPLSASRKITRI